MDGPQAQPQDLSTPASPVEPEADGGTCPTEGVTVDGYDWEDPTSWFGLPAVRFAVLGDQADAGPRMKTLADPFDLRTPAPSPGTRDLREDGPRQPRAPSAGPDGRALLYPLAAVLASDGEIHPEETRLVNSWLAGEGLAPLVESEIRMHLPQDVAHLVPPERRPALLQVMCRTALADGVLDTHEFRVLMAYASAWGIGRTEVEQSLWEECKRTMPRMRALSLRLRRLFLVGFWGLPAEEIEEEDRRASLGVRRSPSRRRPDEQGEE